MISLRQNVLNDAQIITIPKESVVTSMCEFKTIDCMRCTPDEVAKFTSEFSLTVTEDTVLTGIASSFDTHFNEPRLESKVTFKPDRQLLYMNAIFK